MADLEEEPGLPPLFWVKKKESQKDKKPAGHVKQDFGMKKKANTYTSAKIQYVVWEDHYNNKINLENQDLHTFRAFFDSQQTDSTRDETEITTWYM